MSTSFQELRSDLTDIVSDGTVGGEDRVVALAKLAALLDVAEAAQAIDWVFHAGPIEMIAHRNDFGDLHKALAALKDLLPQDQTDG